MEWLKLNSGKEALSFKDFQKKAQPIFVSGASRSGTSLLYHLIDFHPQIMKLFHDVYFFDYYWNYRKKISPKALSKILLGSTGVIKSDDWGKNKKLIHETLKKVLPLVEEGNFSDTFSIVAYIDYLLKGQGQENPTYWAHKNTGQHEHFEKLKKEFPACKFIIIVREPRARCASALAAVKRRQQKVNEIAVLQENAFHWVEQNKLALKVKERYPTETKIIRYEDLVRNPVMEIASLFEFLDLNPIPAEKIQKKVNELKPFYVSRVGNAESSPGIDSESVEKWRNELSDDQASLIQGITQSLGGKFDYFQNEKNKKVNILLRWYSGDSLSNYFKRLFKLSMLA